MKKFYFALGLCSVTIVQAQQFQEVQNLPFKNFYYSASAVGDIDNDGFQDIFFTGAIDSDNNNNVDVTFNELYRNNGGQFTSFQEFNTNAVHLSDVKFIDFDNDGFQDIITTGLSYNDIVNYQQYRFRNTGNGFELMKNLPGKIFGSLEVFDFNHDGKQDYALNGVRYTPNGFTYDLDLYLNSGNDFTEIKAWSEGTQNGDFKVIDVNNDNELDLIILGFNIDIEPIFKVYKNTNGTLVLSQELPVINGGKIAYADFNNDGFLDFVVHGTDKEYNGYLAFFINDGTGYFTENIIEGEGFDDSNVQVGDLNNDGYYDFIINGNDENYDGQVDIFIYNPATNNFAKSENNELYKLGSGGSIQLFDFNNDNKLDVMINGFDWTDADNLPKTKLYQNSLAGNNQKPSAPTVLNTIVEADKILFSWSGANDDKTPENILQYELNVGSASGKSDIAKYVVTTKNWYLKKAGLSSELFWSVKAIDASRAYSNNSQEKTLSILGVSDNQTTKTTVYPNPAKDILHINTNEKIDAVKIYNLAGQQNVAKQISDKVIDVSTLAKGMYLVEITLQNGEKVTRKIIKN
ncbi:MULTISPECIES: T9SS type A sorting domain-containing protein [unclassified Kaistella]|uniref:T9SS type A sorting domain-containing protein n=1 Tax=unclassified Kaistella TaxID=2762626 RepID=UPI00273609B4|nr:MULTISPECIES: T9SS type A sorting domain-containing protein [unclassified Kaistella]MDP2454586.1 T9SS type A sorting domain-containing protein [Kaistella sp. SH11-4b]MDP2457324.1 T9SS type A sorting domain-containing protein [Kaistella sp. SH40-3]MDP2460084.1 T9SS type A sorting domain-containing protein [Kaistella sp. SH19-2b]